MPPHTPPHTPIDFDIDSLNEQELRRLHHRITERLRVIAQLRAHKAMLEFAIGDRVEFDADGRVVRGVIARYNRKTVTLIAEGGERWNVSPGLLRPSDENEQQRRSADSHRNPARPHVIVNHQSLPGPGVPPRK